MQNSKIIIPQEKPSDYRLKGVDRGAEIPWYYDDDQLTQERVHTLKKRSQLQYEKQKALKQLQQLNKVQAQLMFQKKTDELQQIIFKRQKLKKQQEELQQQLNQFKQKKRQYDKNIQVNQQNHLEFQQGKQAGKLQMQRKMLQQQLHDIQLNIHSKKRQYDKIKNSMTKSKAVYQPLYLQKPEKEQYMSPQINKNIMPSYNSSVAGQSDQKRMLLSQGIKNSQAKSNVFKKTSERILKNSVQDQFYQMDKTMSNYSKAQSYLQPGQFNFHGKTLIQKVNPKGKSEEDLIIESLIAQQYDDLKILSKIPKDSQLYKLKLAHFEQMSKIRTQMKQKAHQKRVNKMKRQFNNQKATQQIQRQNQLWVDQNRKVMLSKQTELMTYPDKRQEMQKLIFQSQNMIKGNNRSNKMQQNTNNNNNSNNNQLLSNNNNLDSNRNQNQSSNRNQNYNNSVNNRNNNKTNSFGKNKGQPGKGNNNMLIPNIQPENYVTSISNRVKQKRDIIQIKSRKQLRNELMSSQKQHQSIPYFDNNFKKSKPKLDNLWGYKISLFNLKNYRRSKPIKFKILVLQQQFSKGSFKQQFGTSYHDGRARPEFDPFNPTVNNKFDSQGKIVFNQTFIVKKNLQALHDKTQNQIYLIIILAQKDQTKITNQPTPYAWYCFKITHFARIRQGKYTINLYGDQLNYPNDMNKMKKKLQQEIQIQLQEIVLQNIPSKSQIPEQVDDQTQVSNNKLGQKNDINKPKDSTNRLSNKMNENLKQKTQSSLSSKHSKKLQQRQSSGKLMPIRQSYRDLPQQDVQKVSIGSGGFISNQMQFEFFNVKKKQALNFDIIVKQARTLPSYTGPLKIQVNFLDVSGKSLLPKQQALAQLGNDMYNPIINYTRQVRNETSLTPSANLFIRYLAISTIDYEPYMIGFSSLNLFFDDNGSAIFDNKASQYMISQGLLQIPIFWGSLQPRHFGMSNIIDEYPMLPGASVIMGIVRNKSKISNPLPLYSQGGYNTALFRIDQLQTRLIQYQYKRQPLDTNQTVKGYLHYKGIRKDYSGQQAKKYIQKTLTFPKTVPEVMNVNMMAQYNPIFGLFFCLDKLFIPQGFGDYYYFVTLCISPPGAYYHRQNFDLNIMMNIDTNMSTETQLHYTDNEFYFSPEYNQNKCLIVEVNRIKIMGDEDFSDDLIEGVGHLVLPAFDLGTQLISINVMQNNIQMLDGDLDLNDMKQLDDDLARYLAQHSKVKLSNIEIQFRVLNGYFPNQYKPLPKKSNKKMRSFNKCLSKQRPFKEIRKTAVQIINQNYNINLI